jgi:hypothetical protein
LALWRLNSNGTVSGAALPRILDYVGTIMAGVLPDSRMSERFLLSFHPWPARSLRRIGSVQPRLIVAVESGRDALAQMS